MAGSEGTLQSYGPAELTTARGILVRAQRGLQWQETTQVLRLLQAVQDDPENGGKQADLIDYFAKAVGLGAATEASANEFLGEVIPHFLFLSGHRSPSPAPSPAANPVPTSAGTT